MSIEEKKELHSIDDAYKFILSSSMRYMFWGVVFFFAYMYSSSIYFFALAYPILSVLIIGSVLMFPFLLKKIFKKYSA